jgi:hypothetical protein
MSSGRLIAALALLPVLATGCAAHHPRVAPAPVAEIAPSLPPVQMAALVSPMPPDFPEIRERPVKLDTMTPPEAREEEVVEAPHPSHRRARPAAQDTAQEAPKTQPTLPATTPAQNAAVAAAQPSEDSPIGQLSTPNDTSNTGDRHAINEQIDATETGVNGVKRTLSSDEQKTVAQIRIYISKARDALKADDLDAARTLSNKAHQLLDQLNKD